MAGALRIDRAHYSNARDAAAVLDLLDAYARDPAGGGVALGAAARGRLIAGLAAQPGAFSLLALGDGAYVGLANCFEGFSTFAARRLINIHDVYVAPAWRGQGVVQALLAGVEREASARDCCKITLEVLAGNDRARAAYRRAGFSHVIASPALGGPLFWQKSLG